MWMPDMHFPLDIIWLDDDLSVVYIVEGTVPCAIGKECPSYSSVAKAQYAIEMNAGDAAAYGFRVGVSLAIVS